jgi:crossover junction endodeoxyribonuclease RuvC
MPSSNNLPVPEKIIMGVDPGTNVMGYGIINITGNNMHLLSLGIIKLDHLDNHALKLKHIFERTTAVIEEYKPDEFSIEAPFFGKNVQSMLKLGRAQGVSIAAALNKQVPVFEYSPKKIKQSITGNGNASKEQVCYMLQSLLKISSTPVHFDATDGLAAAVCHFFQSKSPLKNNKGNGWKSFIKNNPGRVS